MKRCFPNVKKAFGTKWGFRQSRERFMEGKVLIVNDLGGHGKHPPASDRPRAFFSFRKMMPSDALAGFEWIMYARREWFPGGVHPGASLIRDGGRLPLIGEKKADFSLFIARRPPGVGHRVGDGGKRRRP
ncbi:MAG TPA: hypothetical protein VNQ90_07715 [Chthoniobacteraceae bacterium]|nr:hypothetical protein [Chthoniobacteraceae bacterium]